ncbi:MAG TPA: peptidylprolyl isomerase [Candidatus Eisenbacteria bacterium]|jgi:cyclophilin family peptidyl-prolyl cis-trans isomerase
MRFRVRALATFTCAALLACTALARAEDQPAAASTAPGDSMKPAPAKAAAKTAAKPAAGAVDAAVKSIDAQIAKNAPNKSDPAWKTKLKIPTIAKFDPAKSYLAHMMTNKGEMVIKFKPDVAPMHVTNFIYLARMGYFDGLKFHRVIKGFMAQGGDPLGTGGGGPGYQFNGEFSPKALHNGPGVVSTANAGPGTDGSQFFIMFKAYPSLDGNYSIFGQVVDGLETLSKFEAAANPGDGPPTEPLFITKVTIEVK